MIDFLLWDEMLEGYQLSTDIDLKVHDLAKLRGIWTASWGAPDDDGFRLPELRS